MPFVVGITFEECYGPVVGMIRNRFGAQSVETQLQIVFGMFISERYIVVDTSRGGHIVHPYPFFEPQLSESPFPNVRVRIFFLPRDLIFSIIIDPTRQYRGITLIRINPERAVPSRAGGDLQIDRTIVVKRSNMSIG